MKSLTIIVLLHLAAINSFAQEKIPVLKGKVNLSIKEGTIDCDFILSDIPPVKDYYLRINTGMNVRYIRNLEDNYSFLYDKDYNDTTHYESFGYYITNKTGKVIRDGYRFNYCGKFPVIADTVKAANSGDWKGNIAFNGYSVRADGSQSAWYPIFYDKTNDKMYDEVRYDIEVKCSDCNTIYINGSAPVQGKTAHFKSDDAMQLMLYAGNYKVVNDHGSYFLNPDISAAQIKEFGEMTKSYKEFYEQKLGIPYKYNITYINTTPITKENAWLFVSYPTIINVGWGAYGMKGLFDKKEGAWFKTYIAHELGHYYFGSYRSFNSELGDMMSEGFGEYLSLQVTRRFFTDSLYNAKIDKKIKLLKDFKPTTFAKVKATSDYKNRELYVYNYAPLIFTAIEREIGMDKMWKWLHAVLTTKQDFTNYAYLERTLSQTLNDDQQVRIIRDKYFDSEASLENALTTIQKH